MRSQQLWILREMVEEVDARTLTVVFRSGAGSAFRETDQSVTPRKSCHPRFRFWAAGWNFALHEVTSTGKGYRLVIQAPVSRFDHSVLYPYFTKIPSIFKRHPMFASSNFYYSHSCSTDVPSESAS